MIIIMICLGGYYLAKKQVTSEVYHDKTSQMIRELPEVSLKKLSDKQQGLYYFGFPTCSWCLALLPVFDERLEKLNVKLLVVNIRAEDYTSQDNILLETFFIKYTSEKRLTVPFVVAINSKGEVKTHIGTVDRHDATKEKMTKKQVETLHTVLDSLILFSNK
ncbi:transporter accessory protein [Lactococcus piscium]|uniref:Transporter accessory protein n=2 Tax=Pseudolactococcus piscium TaxID=1364 RepID=A0A2A5RYA2_9LACT|nr:transporter accessory protein [Lactococcus piscium]